MASVRSIAIDSAFFQSLSIVFLYEVSIICENENLENSWTQSEIVAEHSLGFIALSVWNSLRASVQSLPTLRAQSSA